MFGYQLEDASASNLLITSISSTVHALLNTERLSSKQMQHILRDKRQVSSQRGAEMGV
jgi:hypothetical protein